MVNMSGVVGWVIPDKYFDTFEAYLRQAICDLAPELAAWKYSGDHAIQTLGFVHAGPRLGSRFKPLANGGISLVTRKPIEGTDNGIDRVVLSPTNSQHTALYRSGKLTRLCSFKLTHYLERRMGSHSLPFSK